MRRSIMRLAARMSGEQPRQGNFTGLDSLARIIPVTRPPVPHKRSIS
jgi:hypothetical protein